MTPPKSSWRKLRRHIRRCRKELDYVYDVRALRRAATRGPKPLGFDRIYHWHVRKTAGSSLNESFVSLAHEGLAPEEFWAGLYSRGWAVHNGVAYVAHHPFLLEKGFYFFGYSHVPTHGLQIPANTFTITILRDPVARVISHYRMLRHWEAHDLPHSARQTERHFLGRSFADFIDRLPREHLLRQIYMFSRSYDIDEAAQALSQVNFILMTETFEADLRALSAVLGLELPLLRAKSGFDPVVIGDRERARLRELLEPEYALLERVAPLAGVYRETR